MTEIRTVKMTRTHTGSPDGLHVRTYDQGGTYDLPGELAKAFVEDIGAAIYVEIRGAAETRGKTEKKPARKAKASDKAPASAVAYDTDLDSGNEC